MCFLFNVPVCWCVHKTSSLTLYLDVKVQNLGLFTLALCSAHIRSSHAVTSQQLLYVHFLFISVSVQTLVSPSVLNMWVSEMELMRFHICPINDQFLQTSSQTATGLKCNRTAPCISFSGSGYGFMLHTKKGVVGLNSIWMIGVFKMLQVKWDSSFQFGYH